MYRAGPKCGDIQQTAQLTEATYVGEQEPRHNEKLADARVDGIKLMCVTVDDGCWGEREIKVPMQHETDTMNHQTIDTWSSLHTP